jgi:metallophosphoesterase superfamily enzyme
MRVLDDWVLTAERVAVHHPSGTAVVADLHLGYAEARQRSGECVPDDAVREQLRGLERVLRQHEARRVVIAGDLLEHRSCCSALAAFGQWVKNSAVELAAIVPGNHDPELTQDEFSLDSSLLYPQGFPVAGWCVVHGDGIVPEGQVVQGHEHPCLRWAPSSRALRPRVYGDRIAPGAIESACYLVGSQHLVLPAYSREAAGVNVLAVRRWRDYRCCVLAGDRVLDLGVVSGLGRRLSGAQRR